jgi:hypothetical protein
MHEPPAQGSRASQHEGGRSDITAAGGDGITIVELMVLEQELAWVHGRTAAEGFSPTSPRAHWIGPE